MKPTERDPAAVVAELCAAVAPVAGTETVGLIDADRRVLAASALARCDAPPFDSAAMDGYALRAADAAGGPLREIGRALAGHPFAGAVAAGECVRIMTGAPLPAGADTVVMSEDTRREADAVHILRAAPAHANVRRHGEHLRAGTPVLDAGCRLRAAEIALLAAAGVDRVAVRPRLRVGVLSTGDELVDPPAALEPGATYDANRPLLLRTVTDLGFASADLGICADRGEAFAQVVAQARAAGLDVLLVSGGAAQGDADVVRQALAMRFAAVDVRPGRGIAWGTLGDARRPLTVLGLPGNAVAAWTLFHLVARPVLLHLAGAQPEPLPWLSAPLAHAHSRRGGRTDLLRGRLVQREGAAAVELLREQGSAMLRSVCEADVLVALGPAAEHSAGIPVRVLPLVALRG